ncbi:hypothetical protein Thein_1456 [Thermodesulfatator indicus DSM 15286]|uniref:Uncharacterized protein n=1 Tax=Thermodesulfatator indicus (strain DSM 15286 / JCM 11887 / CIR29812) TaxID=667014 RepID=F8A992_THEID|nr:hypothetical protein [Thermodesulfatator indicus]AEH45319.1 hypothetical protein Thein_1456 [Thermodesulfatator indicus DSM 15286]
MKENSTQFKASPDILAREIWDEAYLLVNKLKKILEEQNVDLSNDQIQDALMGFAQTLFLASVSTFKRVSPEEAEELEREVFLKLAELIIEDFLKRSPTPAEFDYFLTYFRSSLEILRKELAEKGVHPEKELAPDLRKYIQHISSRFLSKVG